MSKAVLMSIKREWVERILSGEKTIEIRKTSPRERLPLKIYIYETKGNKGRGTVVGEFVCQNITHFSVPYPAWEKEADRKTLRAACLTYLEAHRYLGASTGYAWHISKLKIYDPPKSLREFRAPEHNANCDRNNRLLAPPQSFCYVEELE